jgi:ribosome-binding protein aMBF1 (putative translation factor)
MMRRRKGSGMNASKRKKLERAGWKVGTAAELLGLEPAEEAYIELKVRLAVELAARRQKLGLSQKAVAERVRSSQSRIARMEAADSSVSLDLIIRSLLALGIAPKPIRGMVERSIS